MCGLYRRDNSELQDPFLVGRMDNLSVFKTRPVWIATVCWKNTGESGNGCAIRSVANGMDMNLPAGSIPVPDDGVKGSFVDEQAPAGSGLVRVRLQHGCSPRSQCSVAKEFDASNPKSFGGMKANEREGIRTEGIPLVAFQKSVESQRQHILVRQRPVDGQDVWCAHLVGNCCDSMLVQLAESSKNILSLVCSGGRRHDGEYDIHSIVTKYARSRGSDDLSTWGRGWKWRGKKRENCRRYPNTVEVDSGEDHVFALKGWVVVKLGLQSISAWVPHPHEFLSKSRLSYSSWHSLPTKEALIPSTASNPSVPAPPFWPRCNSLFASFSNPILNPLLNLGDRLCAIQLDGVESLSVIEDMPMAVVKAGEDIPLWLL